nr:MAG TPA: hypothetical protein [Caudoviricetes sp.]
MGHAVIQKPGKQFFIAYPAAVFFPSGGKKHGGRVSDEELFTRLLYYGMAHLSLSQDEVWLMPFGLLMDLWECHKQFMGIAKPKQVLTIDDVIPYGI